MLEMVSRALIVAQPVFWIWLNERDPLIDRDGQLYENLFHWGTFWAFVFIALSGFKIGFYTNELILLYMAIVSGFYLGFRSKFMNFKESVCLAFLLTYVNSYYWESIYHLAAIQTAGLTMNQIFQMLHLIPVPYLIWRYEFDQGRAIDFLAIGFAFSGICTYLYITRIWKYIPWIMATFQGVYSVNHGIMILNRIFNAFILYQVFTKAAHKKHK